MELQFQIYYYVEANINKKNLTHCLTLRLDESINQITLATELYYCNHLCCTLLDCLGAFIQYIIRLHTKTQGKAEFILHTAWSGTTLHSNISEMSKKN
jgi:hypothetical protein